MAKDNAFLGTGWGFPISFNKQPGAIAVNMVSEDQDIKESLHILLNTVPGERVMQPSYGCGIKNRVFDTINESAITEIKDMIQRAVLFFEPRITLNSIVIDAGDIYDGTVKIELNYTIRTTNTRSNVVFPFYFREGTHVRFSV